MRQLHSLSSSRRRGSIQNNSHPELVSGSHELKGIPDQVRDDGKMDSRLRGNDKALLGSPTL